MYEYKGGSASHILPQADSLHLGYTTFGDGIAGTSLPIPHLP